MASLIESVRKLHGPHVVAHDNGYDVDVICDECTRLRLESLNQAAGDGEDLSYSAESVRVSYPCTTRIVAGTTAAEGKDEAARMRLERLVVQREEIEEQMERLDAVITLIRRDLGKDLDEADDGREPGDEPEPDDGDDEDPADEEDEKPAPAKHGKKSKADRPVSEQSDLKVEKTSPKHAGPGEEFDF